MRLAHRRARMGHDPCIACSSTPHRMTANRSSTSAVERSFTRPCASCRPRALVRRASAAPPPSETTRLPQAAIHQLVTRLADTEIKHRPDDRSSLHRAHRESARTPGWPGLPNPVSQRRLARGRLPCLGEHPIRSVQFPAPAGGLLKHRGRSAALVAEAAIDDAQIVVASRCDQQSRRFARSPAALRCTRRIRG